MKITSSTVVVWLAAALGSSPANAWKQRGNAASYPLICNKISSFKSLSTTEQWLIKRECREHPDYCSVIKCVAPQEDSKTSADDSDDSKSNSKPERGSKLGRGPKPGRGDKFDDSVDGTTDNSADNSDDFKSKSKPGRGNKPGRGPSKSKSSIDDSNDSKPGNGLKTGRDSTRKGKPGKKKVDCSILLNPSYITASDKRLAKRQCKKHDAYCQVYKWTKVCKKRSARERKNKKNNAGSRRNNNNSNNKKGGAKPNKNKRGPLRGNKRGSTSEDSKDDTAHPW